MNLQIGEFEFYPCKNSETCTSDIKNRFVIVVLIFIYSRMIRKKYASPCSTAKLKINKKLSKTMKLLSYSTKANVSKNRFAKNLVYHHLISKNLENYGSVDY